MSVSSSLPKDEVEDQFKEWPEGLVDGGGLQLLPDHVAAQHLQETSEPPGTSEETQPKPPKRAYQWAIEQ